MITIRLFLATLLVCGLASLPVRAATLEELYSISGDGALINRITSAVAIVAEEIRVDASPPANQAARLVWAKDAFVDPKAKALEMFWAILAVNESATIVQIQSATDAAILTNVRSAVDIFADN